MNQHNVHEQTSSQDTATTVLALVEQLAQELRPHTSCVAVFGSADPVSDTERLVVLAETRNPSPGAQQTLRQQIDARCVDLLGDPVVESRAPNIATSVFWYAACGPYEEDRWV